MIGYAAALLIGLVPAWAPSAISAARAETRESLRGEHIRVSWVAPQAIGPEGATLGVRLQPDPGWHVYWKNPGDSGAAPKFEFSARGFELGPVQWPAPQRLPYAHLTNLGYEGDVVFPVRLRVQDPGASVVRVTADLEWLVCKEECIPGFGELTLERIREEKTRWQAKDQQLLRSHEQHVPGPWSDSPWKVESAAWVPGSLTLTLARQSGKAPTATPPELYPTNGAAVQASRPTVRETNGAYHYTFAIPAASPSRPDTGMVIVTDEGVWEIASLAGVSGGGPGVEGSSLWLLLMFAIFGGAILNLMPCVLPVLSIKLLSLVKIEGGSGIRLREGLLYSLGVLTAFGALGAVFLALRSAGAAVGWGFHLQSPVVVLLLILLFWLMALNFLGVFELGGRVMSWAGRSGGTSSFATGLLAVFVAAPCTGPFMGSALGASATLPAFQAMALFLGLGVGLALPFLMVAVVPALSRRIPKPGAWMERLKQFFAFPLFATVLWLLWVLEGQVGTTGWLLGGMLLLVTAFAFWMARSSKRGAGAFAWVIGIAVSAWALGVVTQLQDHTLRQARQGLAWEPYSRARVEQARARGQAVFIDFTAAWCITCQVNKKAVLETDAAGQLFSKNKVLRVRADWTRQDAEITRALAEFGRNSVPLYVFYPAKVGADPRILPQILTLSDIENLFN